MASWDHVKEGTDLMGDATKEDRKIVERYLSFVEETSRRNQAGEAPRFRTLEAADKALAQMPERIAAATNLVKRLLLIQQTLDTQNARTGLEQQPALEEAFVAIVARFSEEHGISYFAWREFGVEAAVLKRGAVGGAETSSVRSSPPRSLNGMREKIIAELKKGDVEDADGHAVNRLAKQLDLDPKALSGLLKRMEKNGLLRRVTEQRTRRTFKVSLVQ